MHITLRFLFLAGASIVFAGCATSEQRIDNLESQMHNVQVLDIRLSSAENRLSKVESDVQDLRAPLSAPKAASGKKVRSRKDDAHYAPSASTSARRESSPAPVLTPLAAQTPVRDASPVLPPPAIAQLPARPLAGEASVASSQKSASAEYDAALALYYKGQYDRAQAQFSEFLQRHPSNTLSPNAMYWQGECLYAQGKFDSAIIFFKDLAGKYPKHPKAAAALLKAGFAYAQIKDMENARFYWQILVDDFPQSEPANIARKRLAQG